MTLRLPEPQRLRSELFRSGSRGWIAFSLVCCLVLGCGGKSVDAGTPLTVKIGAISKQAKGPKTPSRQITLYNEWSVDPPCNENFPKGCMLYVPGDRFQMGAQSTDPKGANYNASAQAHEGPVHERRLQSFWMHMREVSVAQYERCVRRGGCETAGLDTSGGVMNYGVDGRGSYPMNGIGWADAQQYCSWIGGRLPTESEWEYASRGHVYTHFPWGNFPTTCGAVSARAASPECVRRGTTDNMKTQGISPFWIWDMSGSVWEWTSDVYFKEAYANWVAGKTPKAAPDAPRVIRGGGWRDEQFADLRTTNRGMQPSDMKTSDVGLRCVRDHWATSADLQAENIDVMNVPIPGTERVERVRIWVPGRYRIPHTHPGSKPPLFFYISDGRTPFDDPEYRAVLAQAQARNWVFVQPNLSLFHGKVLGCHSMDAVSDLAAIFKHIVGLFGIEKVEARMFGRGTGSYLSVMFARTEAWLWKSVASWQPVFSLADWFAHQLEFGRAEERDALRSCWGSDPDAPSVQKRDRSHSLRSNNQGTQDVHHLLWASVAPPEHSKGGMALQGIQTYNWLLHGTSDRSKVIRVNSDPALQALTTGAPGSETKKFSAYGPPISIYHHARSGDIELLLIPLEQKMNVDHIFRFLDGSGGVSGP